ncbi:hypothetical protein BO70DRAFT_114229 [Aspergillus heteromorphus CBS 117.55]|uniref:Uncharacterized protein n=1 Tax=Aspergillus heteromorphus CBS 117.55 TaxID=1448321 RepID=A0A317VGG3_9EURO|nr:uncharacterized protein BO70DRAFT_114229 [Aspergillus heteromorphus CBS 117.55]PWY73005.1 hypothetical protein BO70DRAFT_114229 [Aspergillus heteromorphus CBS 117.55]
MSYPFFSIRPPIPVPSPSDPRLVVLLSEAAREINLHPLLSRVAFPVVSSRGPCVPGACLMARGPHATCHPAFELLCWLARQCLVYPPCLARDAPSSRDTRRNASSACRRNSGGQHVHRRVSRWDRFLGKDPSSRLGRVIVAVPKPLLCVRPFQPLMLNEGSVP